MGIAARQRKVSLPVEAAIDAEVNLCAKGSSYFLRARLNVTLPGLSRDDGAALIESAHVICPYSKLSRGNIDVLISLVESGTTIPVVETRAAST
jgi:organic hydroperoxide reductase OsmC/OhrA